MAMIRQLGIPTWFMTLTAADMKWPDIIQAIAEQYGEHLTDEQVAALSWQEKCKWLSRNPVTAARHFQHRLQTLFTEFLCSSAHPIGEIIDYVIRIEFQARGAPHAHIIIWIKDAPTLDEEDGPKKVASFIDRYQTCAIPPDGELRELVLMLLTHRHSSQCRKRGSCRFKFPRMPSDRTVVATEPDDENRKAKLNRAAEIFTRVKEVLSESTNYETLEQMLSVAGVTKVEYEQCLGLSTTGNNIVLKRSPQEANINFYNPDLLLAWRANMDLQFILDPYACVMYITTYMLKSEKTMTELLKQVLKENRGEDLRKKMKSLASAFITHREISAQEAAYRLLSIPLKKMSRTVVFVSSSPKAERHAILKPLSQVTAMEDGEEDLFHTSLVDRYAARPDTLKDMCLAEFASLYATRGQKEETSDAIPEDQSDEEDEDQIPDSPPIKIELQNNLGFMYKKRDLLSSDSTRLILKSSQRSIIGQSLCCTGHGMMKRT
jgi:hypothetical protein